MSVLFYNELGFSKTDIGIFSKRLRMSYNYCIHTSRRAINYQIWCNKGGFFAGIFMASTNLLFALLAIN